MFTVILIFIVTVLLNTFWSHIPLVSESYADTSSQNTKVMEYSIYDYQIAVKAINETKTVQPVIKIGLLIIVNGNRGNCRILIDSARKHFINLPGYKITYFMLGEQIQDIPKGPDVIKVEIKFSNSSLQSYFHTYLTNAAVYAEMDYIFALQANIYFDNVVGPEVLGDLVAVLHPDFHDWRRNVFPYETRPESSAFVNDNLGLFYAHAAFYGGKKDIVLSMLKSLDDYAKKDRHRNFTAIRKDESYINYYLIYHPPSILLNSVNNFLA